MKILDFFRKVKTLSVDEARELLAGKQNGEVSLIDVRQPEEYEQGHLPGAQLIPLSELLNNVEKLDPAKTALLYCKRGGRSKSAASLLEGQGFDNVYSMDGGIDAWNGLVASGQYEAGMFLLDNKRTAEELVSLAWALEEGARAFYEHARDVVNDNDAKNIYDSLINAEEKHKAIVFDVYRVTKGEDITEESLKRESSTGFMEGGVSINEALSWLKDSGRTLQDILEFTMQMEINSLDLYIKMRSEIEDKEANKVFDQLIKEEKAHLSRLGRLLGDKLDK